MIIKVCMLHDWVYAAYRLGCSMKAECGIEYFTHCRQTSISHGSRKTDHVILCVMLSVE